MTKTEAIEAMKKGEKVTHIHFTDEEFITMKDGVIIDEKDYHLDPNEFWSYRINESWGDGWGLFTPSPDNH